MSALRWTATHERIRVMRVTLAGLLGLATVVLLVSPALALPPGYPDSRCEWKRQAPDMCGPGFVCIHPCGMIYCPSYYV